MPLTCSEDLESFVIQTYQERRVCPRLIVQVDKQTAVRKSVPRNIFRKSARASQHQNEQQARSSDNDSISEIPSNKEMCGPSDERMSWGLHFYEQQDKVNRAHFPDVYDAKDGRPTIEEGTDEEDDPIQESREIVDWKYNPPDKLRTGKHSGKGNNE